MTSRAGHEHPENPNILAVVDRGPLLKIGLVNGSRCRQVVVKYRFDCIRNLFYDKKTELKYIPEV